MYHGIAIVGANGSGKSTLGRELAALLGYRHMDVEDYCFLPSEIPYSKPRDHGEEEALILADMRKYKNFIFTGAGFQYSDEAKAMLDLVIYLQCPLDVRLNRIRQRAIKLHGERVFPGGDMYEQELDFFRFVAGRTMEKTDRFVDSVSIPVIYAETDRPLQQYLDLIRIFIESSEQQPSSAKIWIRKLHF